MRIRSSFALMTTVIAVIVGVSYFKHWLVNRPRTSGSSYVTTSNLRHSAAAEPAGKVTSGESGIAYPESMPVGHMTTPRVSPYAVVSNGICAPTDSPGHEEVSRRKWEALLTDPFWQSIFVGVDPEKFSLVRTELPMQRYVTYWKMQSGQMIHWTGKKITIPSGTRLFTDGRGKMFLCTCGNQVAVLLPPGIPQKPGMILPPEDEPPVAYLVPEEPHPFPLTSVGPSSEIPLTPLPLPGLAMVPSVSSPVDPTVIPPVSPPVVIPPVFPPVVIPPVFPPPIVGRTSPTASVPEEPNTLSLALLGLGSLGALFFAFRYRKQK